MKLWLSLLVICALIAQILASDHKGDNRGQLRSKREEDYEPDDRDIEEVKAALARKPKIARPAYSSLNKKKKKPKSSTPATPTTEAAAETEAPKLDQPPKFEVRTLKADQLQSQDQGTPLPKVLPAKVEVATVKRPKGKAIKLSAKGSVKGGAGAGGSKSPIAKGKSMYRPRPQVPTVVAPVPVTELLVPGSPSLVPVREYVNSIQEKVAPVVAAPALAPQPVVVPVARQTRPKPSPKSKYLESYPLKAELSPAYRSKALSRAEVSEDPYEECPYGMRLSVCRARAAARLAAKAA